MKNRKNRKILLRIDPSLDKYNDKVLNKEKVEKANEAIKKFGFPDINKIQ
jgi:hypothetical protein